MNKYLLMLACAAVFSCTPEDIIPLEESTENLMGGTVEETEETVTEETTATDEALFGTWVANKVTINNQVLDSMSCELDSSITLLSEHVYSDRFFQEGSTGCEPGFVSGAWESEGDRIILNYNNGGGVYIIWEVLEVSEEKLSLKLFSLDDVPVTAANEQFWEYRKS